jgi:hypothetical protein
VDQVAEQQPSQHETKVKLQYHQERQKSTEGQEEKEGR